METRRMKPKEELPIIGLKPTWSVAVDSHGETEVFPDTGSK
jgi:hypothetical protein